MHATSISKIRSNPMSNVNLCKSSLMYCSSNYFFHLKKMAVLVIDLTCLRHFLVVASWLVDCMRASPFIPSNGIHDRNACMPGFYCS